MTPYKWLNKLILYYSLLVAWLEGDTASHNLSELSDWLEWPEVALKRWISETPTEYAYHTFQLRKRGRRGWRTINAPNDNLLKLQGRIYHKLLKSMRPNHAATGFVPGRSIVDNAIPHIGQEVVINIDLKDFFHSIHANKVYRYWRSLGWDVVSSTILTNICCHENRLPQGAPTSPALSNLTNRLLDARLAGLAKKLGGNYTRYADDITLSFPKFEERHKGVVRSVLTILSYEGYQIQKKKRVRIQRPHQRQTATGLIVNQKVNLPRHVRRRIRAMRHHRAMGTLSSRDEARLSGYEALLQMIDKVQHPVAGSHLPAKSYREISAKERILLLAAGPSDISTVGLAREFREIYDSLELAKAGDRFEIFSRLAVRPVDITRFLLKTRPRIVHFSGHATEQGEICLENNKGKALPVAPDVLSQLFARFSGEIECVFLNACFSDHQAEAIVRHIPYVIGMSHEVNDNVCTTFAVGFYQAIWEGNSVEDSYKMACIQVHMHGTPEYFTPILKVRSDA